MIVDHIELRHEDVNRGHAHERREHPEHERYLHERFPRLKFKARDGVGGEDDEQRPYDAAHGRDEQCVEEPLRIVVHRRIRKQRLEAVQAVIGREESVE